MFGRSAPPQAYRARFDPHERVLSWCSTASGAAVVATDRGLWWPDPEPRRIDWHLVDKVVWNEAGFTVTEAVVVDDLLLVERAPSTLALETDPRKLPATVKRRVESNVVHTYEVQLTGGSARLVARKIAGRDGLVWWARLDPGTEDSDAVRDELAGVIADIRDDRAEYLRRF